MAGQQRPKRASERMYGTSITEHTNSLTSISDRVTRETVLDCLLNTPYPLAVSDIAIRANEPPETVEAHLNALIDADIATTADNETYTTSWETLPLDGLVDTGDTAEVFLLEARDKEYREWFGVDDPYDATHPKNTDLETAIAAVDQWFGIRKRLHQLADPQ